MIGKNLLKLRKLKKFTQEELAEMVGVARQTIAKWETEESTPDLALAARLASALDVTLDDLVSTPPEALDTLPSMKGKYMFGVVTVGDKGQIVIPVRARRIFRIKPGDQLLVLGDVEQGIALVDAQYFMRMAEEMKNDI